MVVVSEFILNFERLFWSLKTPLKKQCVYTVYGNASTAIFIASQI